MQNKLPYKKGRNGSDAENNRQSVMAGTVRRISGKCLYRFFVSAEKILLPVFLIIPFITTAQHYTENEVKAAFIVNFIKFVEWPDTSDSNIEKIKVIGIYRKNPFGHVLENMLKNRMIGGSAWTVIHLTAPEEIRQCDLLFINNIGQVELTFILNIIEDRSILTIGDNIKDFCQNGGIINYTGTLEKKAFEINKMAAVRQNLEISSKLLYLAELVEEDVAVF
ncbi:MAG: YfiR family protein [Bacteroidetes bacterium]|nr:YfiR family protein [Bacteroidota bacterium]